MKILLTGITGLLGKELLPQFNKNDELFCIVRNPPSNNLVHYLNQVQFISHSLSLPLDFSKLPKQIDAIIHMAQSSKYKLFPMTANDIFSINTLTTFQLMEYARQAGAKFFLYTSTGSIYERDYAFSSEESRVEPCSFYPATKLASEVLLNSYRPFFKVCIMRLFFLYGKYSTEDRIIASLFNRVKKQIPIELEGTHGLEFTPTYSNDVASLVMKALTEQWEGCINVATPEVTTLREVSLKIGKILTIPPKFKHMPKNPAPRIVPNLTKLSQFYPTMKFTSLDQGLEKTFSN